jgi:hypothetical protein
MTADDIEQDALECWALYRTMARQEARNSECVPSMEVWVIAYAAGVELGRELERQDCALLADGLCAVGVAEAIRARVDFDDDTEDADEE